MDDSEPQVPGPDTPGTSHADEAPPPNPTTPPRANLRIETIRAVDFRALRDVSVTLETGTTLLVGENNTGKSSLLVALDVALGGRRATPDDLHVASDGVVVAEFRIDVTIVPALGDRFDEAVGTLYGTAVRRDEHGGEIVAIRTTGRIGPDPSSVDLQRSFLERRVGSTVEEVVEISGPRVSERHLKLIACSVLDASRDLVEQLRSRLSPWGRLLTNLDLPADVVAEVEASLAAIGGEVVGQSPVLGRLRDHLQEVQRALATIGEVSLEPLPVNVGELGRAIDVRVAGPKGAPLPLRMQGLGSRSLAELMVVRAFAATLAGVGEAVEAHSVSCFEEPEAHLHPQAQVAVARIIDGFPGQRIITTHSAHIASEASLTQVRLLRRSGSGIDVRMASGLSDEDLIKVRRLVERPYGQVLFAKLVVIGDGATERAALPVFARAHWAGTEMEGKCVTLVDPQSLSQANHLVRLLDKLGIPWLVLADGDEAANKDLQAIGTLIGRVVDGTSPEVVQLKAGDAFEQCLMSCGVTSAIEQGIAAASPPNALVDFKAKGQNAHLDDDELLLKFLIDTKPRYAAAVAEAMVAVGDADGNPIMPPEVRELLRRADVILEASK